MTLVASFIVNQYPLIISDLLLSAPEVLGRSVNLPTVGDIGNVFPEGSGFIPSGITQKIAVISDNFVIGWAGAKIAAKTVIRELFEENKKKPFTYDSLMHYFSLVDEIIWNQGLHFVGFIANPNNPSITREFSSIEALKLDSPLLGSAKILGSGAEDFSNLLKDSHHMIPPSREMNQVEYAVYNGLCISGSALSLEIPTHQSLLNYYGGGYEIVSLFNHKFKKLGDITYFFWYGEITKDIFNMRLHHFCNYSYINDNLLIRVAKPQKFTEKINQNDYESSIFLVTPIYRDVKREEIDTLPLPSFNSKILCNYFFTKNLSTKGIEVYSNICVSGNEKPPIQFKENGKKLNISIEKEWFDDIAEQVRKYIRYN